MSFHLKWFLKTIFQLHANSLTVQYICYHIVTVKYISMLKKTYMTQKFGENVNVNIIILYIIFHPFSKVQQYEILMTNQLRSCLIFFFLGLCNYTNNSHPHFCFVFLF